MFNKILSLINGALGQQEFDPISPAEEYYPENGVVLVPDFFEMEPPLQGGLYLGPECKLLVSEGIEIIGGMSLAEINTPSHVFEVASTCSGTVSEIFIETGQIVEPGQPLLKIERP